MIRLILCKRSKIRCINHDHIIFIHEYRRSLLRLIALHICHDGHKEVMYCDKVGEVCSFGSMYVQEIILTISTSQAVCRHIIHSSRARPQRAHSYHRSQPRHLHSVSLLLLLSPADPPAVVVLPAHPPVPL